MIDLKDPEGREIRLTDERFNHILEHPEMQGQESRVNETLRAPQMVVQSHHDASVRLFH